MVITNHAKLRMKKRCGLNKKSMERMATKALESGVRHKDTIGALNRWISGLYLQELNANNVRLYGEYAFLFHFDTLITVIEIPNRFKGNKYLKKAKVEND